MEHIKGSKPTNKRHINNLNKLADLLDSDKIPPPRFHMGQYAIKPEDEEDSEFFTYDNKDDFNFYYLEPNEIKKKDYKSCGTICCALGHGPLAGIKAKGYYSWSEYSKYKFGVVEGHHNEITNSAWHWLFSYNWKRGDNTPKGAAKRIRYYIKNGVPVDFHEQSLGYAELTY